MNLLLLEAEELGPDGRVCLAGRRARHLIDVIRVEPERRLRVGVVDQGLGQGTVLHVGPDQVTLRVDGIDAGSAPRSESETGLILALPRPKAWRRILQTAAAMGLSRLEVVNAWHVDKSYFGSPFLEHGAIRAQLLLGAEQGVRCRLPEVALHRHLMPFLEELPPPGDGEVRLLAQPTAHHGLETLLPLAPGGGVIAAVGPERGWTEREVATFARHGFVPITLDPGVLRCELAVAALLAQLSLCRRIG